MVTYQPETHESCARGKVLTVSNLTPQLRPEERSAARRDIEQQLYEVFCKYVSSATN